ncbi:MAG: hypothetical protein Q9221_005822 [Calogaya cf. arnoldii]
MTDVQRKWADRYLADHAILKQVNALSNRNYAVWWRPIVRQRLQDRAKSEGQKVSRQFQYAARMDQETAKWMAELINTEQMDIITFEAMAGNPDDTGKRPTLQAIRERRQAFENHLREKLAMDLEQGDINPSQASSHAAPTESAEMLRDSRLGQPIEYVQAEAPVTFNSGGRGSGQSSRMGRPVDLSDDSQTDTRSPTPNDTTRTADTTITTSEPIIVGGQGVKVDTSPRSSESLHKLEISKENPTPDASSLFVASSDTLRESGISLSDQIPTVHNDPRDQGQEPQSSTNIPQGSVRTVPDPSSPQTPARSGPNAPFAPAPVQPSMDHVNLWQNIRWAYRTHTPADIELQNKGIWLYERPVARTPGKNSNDLSSLQLQKGCHVVISSDFEDRSEPYLEYNDTALTIYTHLPPWTNGHRSIENFAGIVPDFRSEVPLAEYQILEALGSHVWRHDRDLLPCRGPDCKTMLSDIATGTIICQGCGPKSIVRFCSIRCHLASLPKHVLECWNPRLLINKVIDENTAPPRFSLLAPSLRDRHGYRTYQNYRQRVAAQYAGGLYSMFNPATEEATVITWDRCFSQNRRPEKPYHGYATDMESRIERCLNIALFDHSNTPILEHLYRLLQRCLQVKKAWGPGLAALLTRQFRDEFDYDVNTSLRVRGGASFCECEWEGGALRTHEATCSERYRGHGEVIQGQRSIRDMVEGMENRYWILRAWQQRHQTENAWNRRVMGVGFPGVVVEEGWMPKLGRRWVGFNGEEDDVVS